jgi:hypothetical protein
VARTEGTQWQCTEKRTAHFWQYTGISDASLATHLMQRGEVQLDPHLLLQHTLDDLLLGLVSEPLPQQQEAVPRQLFIACGVPLSPAEEVAGSHKAVLAWQSREGRFVSPS